MEFVFTTIQSSLARRLPSILLLFFSIALSASAGSSFSGISVADSVKTVATDKKALSKEEAKKAKMEQKKKKNQEKIAKDMEKKKRKQEEYQRKHMTNFSMIKQPGTTYVFGFSQLLGDSIIYLTNITEIDSLKLQKKTRFLPFRSEFSLQLKAYLEGTVGLTNQTTCVFFNKKRSKLLKTFNKIKKRYLDEKGNVLRIIDDANFKFVHPLDHMNQDMATDAVNEE